MRSVKLWLYLFSADGPHSLVVKGTHSQVRTASAVVRPSPESHAKQQSSATVAIILIPLLTCIHTVKTLNIGTPRPATVVVLNIKQFNFTMK